VGLRFASPAAASPQTRLSVDLAAGHDDQVLASQDLGVISPVSERFFTGASRLFLRWDPPASLRRLDLLAQATGTSYGSRVSGNDSDLRLTARYREGLGRRLLLDSAVAGWRFRREDAEVFDLDLLRGDVRLGWSPRSSWLLSLGARYTHNAYPNRRLPADSTRSELQQPFDLIFGALRGLGRTSYVGAEASYRFSASNTSRSRYRGPIVILRSGAEIYRRISLSGYAVYGRRDYREARVIVPTGESTTDTLGMRHDDAWQIGMALERAIGDRMRIFLDANYLIQNSNASFADFDQAQISLGVSVDLVALGRRGDRVLAVSETPPLAPVIQGSRVRFRILAPEATSVSVVGGFNGWDPSRNPLQGPDAGGMWETSLTLDPGIWRYAFVVDGVWTMPPDAPRYEDDGFGGLNGVIEITGGSPAAPVTNGGTSRPRR
jgi:hypothetical protein